ncbi:MAG: SDR family NAD(P)-dependent oxidoreductase [Bacillota bacterium]|nr:SDR family NAD(P)-dependent oxidoreductase [Bacillota bacterium]
MGLRCKHILVTGVGNSISLAITSRLLHEDAQVVIAGRHMEKLAKAARDIQSNHLQVMARDVDDLSVCREKLAEAAKLMDSWGEIICGHTVVANGGDNADTL